MSKQPKLEQFVQWLVCYSTPDDRFSCREHIKRMTNDFVKEKVLDEIERQSHLPERVIITQLIKAIPDKNNP